MLNLANNPLKFTPPPTLAVMPNPLLQPRPTSTASAEREMDRLPHLAQDRRHVDQDTHRQFLDARRAKDTSEAIGRLPAADEALHLAISGRFALWHCVPAALALAGCAIVALTIATLGFSRDNIDELCKLIDAGQIGRVTLLCSHYFKSTSQGIFEHAQAELAKRGDRCTFLSARQHAKLLLIELANGATVTVESSANLRSCKNIETMTLIGSPELYRFHLAWIDSLAEAQP